MQIGKYIKQLRTERNLSIRDLAAKIDLSPATVSLIERDINSPTLDYLTKICAALNIYLVDLLQMCENDEKEDMILRKAQRKQLTFPEEENIYYELISNPKKNFKILSINMEPKCDYRYVSEGYPNDEIALVIEGKMEIVVNDAVYILEEGDTIYLEAGSTYKYRNAGVAKCISLFAIQGVEHQAT